jgi:hypothetical protein
MSKFTIALVSTAIFLGGCAAPPVVTLPPAQLVNIPAINTEAEAEIGQTIISKAFRRTYPAILLPTGIVEGRFGTMGQIKVNSGVLYLLTEDANGKYYRDRSATWGSDSVGWSPMIGGIFVPHDKSKPSVNFNRNPMSGWDFGKIPSTGITDTTYEDWDRDSFKRELVYSGVSQNTVSILYREFKDDFARPAFSQDLKYDLTQGNEIGFRGARFQVIKAGNTVIRYKVLRALD